MFESSLVISKKRRWRRLFWASLPASLVAHLSVLIGLTAAQAWDASFPVAPPQTVEPYLLLVAAPLPPMPPPPPPAPRLARTAPAVRLPDGFAPTAIPDETPDLLPTTGAAWEGVEGGSIGGVAGGELGGVVGGVEGSVAPLEPSPHAGTFVVARDANLPLTIVSRIYPTYPRKLRRLGVEDSLVLRYRIDKRGRVVEAEILVRPQHSEFATESIKAVRSWRFEPHLIDGEPVEVVHELTVNFRIERLGG